MPPQVVDRLDDVGAHAPHVVRLGLGVAEQRRSPGDEWRKVLLNKALTRIDTATTTPQIIASEPSNEDLAAMRRNVLGELDVLGAAAT